MSIRYVLDQITDVLEGLGVGLRRGSYRRPLELEPNGWAHRRFAVELTAARITRPIFGDGECPILFDLVVRVAYARGGGDAGGGDRRSVNVTAAQDAILIADALSDERNWNRAVTAIREIRYLTSAPAVDADRIVVWASRFTAEVMYTWPA